MKIQFSSSKKRTIPYRDPLKIETLINAWIIQTAKEDNEKGKLCFLYNDSDHFCIVSHIHPWSMHSIKYQ